MILKIDGVEYSFGTLYLFRPNKIDIRGKTLFESFWSSGGCLDSDYEPIQAEWKINVEKIPEQFRKYALEIDRVFNENVPFGCCGGCS